MATRWWVFCAMCDEQLSRHDTEARAIKEGELHKKNKMSAGYPGHVCVPQPVEVPDDTPSDDN